MACGFLGSMRKYFNPRSREGSDTKGDEKFVTKILISIHAPAKGATFRLPESKRINKDFNPRSREGSDDSYDTLACVDKLFQSTLPRRERLCACALAPVATYDFNPRSREGSDALVDLILNGSTISIHAPAKGATSLTMFCPLDVIISIHAPAKGAT